jgi:hypothetical protein
MRQDEWFTGQPLCVREPFKERNTGASSSSRGRGFSRYPRRGRELADDLTAAFACHRHHCRPTFVHIDRRAFSRGGLTRGRCAWLALLGHARGCLESWHQFCSREGAVLAQVAVQFFARSNRRAGYMTCGPGPPCWTRRS